MNGSGWQPTYFVYCTVINLLMAIAISVFASVFAPEWRLVQNANVVGFVLCVTSLMNHPYQTIRIVAIVFKLIYDLCLLVLQYLIWVGMVPTLYMDNQPYFNSENQKPAEYVSSTIRENVKIAILATLWLVDVYVAFHMYSEYLITDETNAMLRSQLQGQQWKTATSIPLQRKHTRREPRVYRGVVVTDVRGQEEEEDNEEDEEEEEEEQEEVQVPVYTTRKKKGRKVILTRTAAPG